MRVAAVCYAALLALVWGCANSMMYHPPHSYADGAQVRKIATKSGRKISAVYLSKPEAEFTILFSHGNAEDLGTCEDYLLEVHRRGYNVLAYDYQGYGTSEGKPTEKNTYEDITAAYEYLTRELGAQPERVIVLGRSIGSGPTVWLATQRPVGGMILEGAFTSIVRVGLGAKILLFDYYDNLARIDDVHCPVLMMHGRQDRVIPFRHGQALFAKANEPKMSLWVEGADHNDLIEAAGEAYWAAIGGFIGKIQKRGI